MNFSTRTLIGFHLLLCFYFTILTESFISPLFSHHNAKGIPLFQSFQSNNEDIWSTNTPLSSLFEPKFLRYLKKFYDKNVDEKMGLMSYQRYSKWKDVQDMLDFEEMDIGCLRTIWAEALIETNMDALQGDGLVNFDTFVRINGRLEEVINSMQSIKSKLSSAEKEKSSLSKSFLEATQQESLMSFSQFVSSPPVERLLIKNAITLAQIESLWRLIPKHPLGAFYAGEERRAIDRREDIDIDEGSKEEEGKEQGEEKQYYTRHVVKQSEGIRVDGFIMLVNEMLALYGTENEEE